MSRLINNLQTNNFILAGSDPSDNLYCTNDNGDFVIDGPNGRFIINSTGPNGPTGPQGPTGIPGYSTILIPSNTGVIPVMTSSTTSGFTISASTEFDSNYAAWKACDGNITTSWAMLGTGFPSFWNVQCPSQFVIWKIEISKREGSPASEWINTFYFEGSNDNVNWTTLAYSSGQMASIGSPPNVLSILISDSSYQSYSYFRVRCISGTGPNPGFAIFQMYAYGFATYTSPTGPTGPNPYLDYSLSSSLTGSNYPNLYSNPGDFDFYQLDTTNNPINITLPLISSLINGKRIHIFTDVGGNLSRNNAILNATGTNVIGNSNSLIMNIDYSSIQLAANGSDRWIVY